MEPVVLPGVMLGVGSELGPFCFIGRPPRGAAEGELETHIGEGAVIRSHTVIYAGNRIGRGFQTGHHVMVREHNEIGDDVSIGTGSVVEHHVTIEDGVRIHTNAFVPEFTQLMAGCWIGPNAVLTNARYPLSRGVKERLEGPVIGAGAVIGANVTLLPGVRIGAGALVGAGSVVVCDVAPDDVVVGNPARRIKSRKELPYS